MSEFLNRISNFSPKRLALLADELQRRVLELESARHEPIAIVGIGCRFPGGANTPEQFWELLRAGVDAIRDVPADRWDAAALYDPDPDAPGKMATRWGGFIDEVDRFDPHFFGISPREAQNLDPQQRLLLEVTWAALEDAGISPQRLEGTHTSVYLGLSAADYYQIIRGGGTERLDAYTASGVAHSVASGRLSYVLGLRGPSVSIDTACSSSLVAIHHAVQSLRRGESAMALAGGVNLVLGPDITIALSKARMMAPDGRCKAFDSRADGFVRGEGCGMLVLKRLSDAQADGDRIIAVIRGSAANQDGRSNGLTAPNGPSQEAVLSEALADANVQPGEVGFVEAHGTGTALGDPIEVQALGAVYGAGRAPGEPLLAGSVKANIGHLEAAAGVASVIKLAMALRHGEVPGQLHLLEPNPHIAWHELPVRVPTALVPWPRSSTARRIGGVSSFGFSGTNVHMVLEQAPELAPAAENGPLRPERPLHLLTVSARDHTALQRLAAAYGAQLRSSGDALADVAFSANAGRAHFAHRAAVLASAAPEAAEALERLARGDVEAAMTGTAPARAPRIAFLFTGQGSQYAGMARSLFDSEPVFRAALERCDELLRPHMTRPLLSVLFSEGSSPALIDDTEYTQPALFAVEYALAQLWASWGIRPSLVMGHSVGEVVAACVAGAFSLEDALKLIAVRGRLMGSLPRDGAMCALMAPESQVAGAIAPWRDEIGIAAINGPVHTVISGQKSRVERLAATLGETGIKCTPLNVSHAFHSPLMRPILEEFAQTLAGISFSPCQIDLVSNVTGTTIGARVATPEYWREHVLAPVQFMAAVQTVAQAGCDVFLEIGPHPTLLGMARQCVEGESSAWLPSLRKGRDDWAQMLESLAALYVRGADVDWRAFDVAHSRRRVTLPGYPFQRERYWVDAAPMPAAAAAVPAGPSLHPLLGREVLQSMSTARLFETQLTPARLGYLEDHRIRGALLLPSPAFMEMALAAAREQFGGTAFELQDFTVQQALPLESASPVTTQLVLQAPTHGGADFCISSYDPAERRWAQHAAGRLASIGAAPAAIDLEAIQARTTSETEVKAYYEWLGSLGLEFGPRFRAARTIARRDGEVLARMQLPEAVAAEAAAYALHPAALDACLHLIGAALPGAGSGLREAFLLLNVERARIYRRPEASFWAHITVRPDELRELDRLETFRAELRLLDDGGAVLAELEGLHLKRARPEALVQGRIPARVRSMIHEIVWREAPATDLSLPAPGVIAERILPQVAELAARNGLDAYAQFFTGLDALASGYVVQALHSLGCRLVPGERLDAEALRASLGVLDCHRRLFARMLAILAEDAVLVADGPHWRVLRTPPALDCAVHRAELLARHPDCAAELTLTSRCGQELAAVLRGKTDPLTLLFPGGSLVDAENLYQGSPPAKTYNGLIAAIFAALRDGAPAGRPLRILEIGAGTGSTTSYVLGQLQGGVAAGIEYTFTDVSPLFLTRAAEKFQGQSGMRYQLLDIGSDPLAQGFERETFDVVVGANVLHATPDLEVTLAHVRSLMRPGGLLVLLEGTVPQRFGDLTVGLLEGWWAWSDTQRRNYALMPRAAWLELLGAQGFVDPVAIPGESSGPVLSQQAIFLARAPLVARRRPSRWLIVPDRGGVAESAVRLLHAAGDVTELLSPRDPAALGEALHAALDAAPCAGVLFLPALDLRLSDATTAEALLAGQQALLGTALRVVQTLAVRSGESAPRLWLATRGAQATAVQESANAAQATLWGLSHVVALEHPELACTRIDLDPAATAAASVATLIAALHTADREDQLAVRGERRLVRRLVPHHARPEAASSQAVPVRVDRSYLVTGGLRGLGLRVGEWLAEQGVRHLVLMGRSAPDAQAVAVVQRLQARGVQVLIARGDVGVRVDVERVLGEIPAQMPALAGIVHAAGVLDDGVLTAQSWPRFATVMGPKVSGTWHLHTLAKDLDFMVLFSSGASVAGSAGQANHAAANAFEDALAWYRQAQGRPTVSINWGPWAEIGAAATREIAATGLRPLAPADGLAALQFAMRLEGPGRPFQLAQLAVLATDWTQLTEPAASGRLAPLFAELAATVPREAPRATDQGASAPKASLHERIRAAAPNRRKAVLRDFVRQQTAKVLGARRAEELDLDEPLRQLGLDSLMAVELRNVLGKAVQRTLPATVTFDYPSVAALVEFLSGEVFAEEIASPAAAPGVAPAQDTLLDALSEGEFADRLARRLEGLGNLERS